MAPATIIPTQKDILYGRGDFSIKHVGNVAFRTLIGLCLNEYKQLPAEKRSYKHSFLEMIVLSILNSGGHFCRRNNGGQWEEVSPEKARRKVAQELQDVVNKPHILETFSLVHSPTVYLHYKSAWEFNWADIVEACEQELKLLETAQDPTDCDFDLQQPIEKIAVPLSSKDPLSRLSSFSAISSDISIHGLMNAL